MTTSSRSGWTLMARVTALVGLLALAAALLVPVGNSAAAQSNPGRGAAVGEPPRGPATPPGRPDGVPARNAANRSCPDLPPQATATPPGRGVSGPPGTLPPQARRAGARGVTCTDITLLYDTHFHGKFGGDDQPTVAEYFGFVAERKAATPNPLFIGNGDDIAPSLESGVFLGTHMIDVLNEAPVDVNTFGNHEFDYGPDTLRGLVQRSDFPWVTANVRDIDTGEPFAADLGVEQFIIEDLDGVQVGITGLGPVGMASITSLGDQTEQIDPVDAMREVVPEMEAAGADVVVVASHLCSPDARRVAAEVDGIDAIVGDHCAAVLEEPEIINDTIVSFVGDEFRRMGELQLRVVDGQVVAHDFTLHDLREMDLEADPQIQAVVDHYTDQLDEALNVVIGVRTVEWDTRNATVRHREAAIGNFLTDEMRDHYDADIAVQNSGGIRANRVFPAGDITRRDIAEILPFMNHVSLAEIPGDLLHDALEHSVHGVGDGIGRFLQVSGIEFTYDAARAPYDRVDPADVFINGEPLDLDATYTMATNDFTLGGGDDFDMFTDERVNVIVGGMDGPLLSSFIIQRIEARDFEPITTDVEGRITRLN